MSARIKLSRREFLRLSTLAAAGGLLVGCGGAATEAPGAGDETEPEAAPPVEDAVVVQWWSGWGGTTAVDGQSAVEAGFNSSGASCTVEFVSTTEMNDKLMTAIAGDTPPDVGVCCVSYASYYARDAFMPLDSFIDASSVIKRDDFVAGLFESMTWQGKTLGVPAFECGPRYGLVYNKRIVSEAGLDPEAPPRTWSEMMTWHETITTFDAAGNVDIVGYDPRDGTGGAGPATNVMMFWAITQGLDMWDDAALKFDFDNDKLVSSLKIMKEFYDFVGVEKMAAFRDSFGGWTQSPSSSFPS
jgi:ABC-type glycerol-3-phosphate transport system substrate-binding protein